MPNITVTNNEKRGANRPDIYREFILWTALPYKEKIALGIETQGQFAEYYKVHINTTTAWKQRPEFEARVDEILKIWSNERTPEVIHAIYRTAVKGNPMSQLLWLQYFKRFNPKKEEDTGKKGPVLSVGDIRYMIEILPDELKQKHYGYLRELTEDVSAFRNAGGVSDEVWYEKPTQDNVLEVEISEEKYLNQENIEEKTRILSKCYRGSVCCADF